MKLKVFFYLAILLTAILPLQAQTGAVSSERGATDETTRRRQSFDLVWNTINEKHFDKTFGGVNWQKTREIYEPKAQAAKSNDEFHAVLRQMLGELKLSHFSVFPLAAQNQSEVAVADGTLGAELKMIDGRAVIFRVSDSSPAASAGIKPGFAVEKIGGKRTAEILAPLEKSMTERKLDERMRQVYRERTLQSMIDGKTGVAVQLELSDGSNRQRALSVIPVEDRGEMSPALGNFPPQKVVFESKRLDGDIGYIRFNIWVIPQMAKIRQAVKEFASAKGIIFDVRGNPGGVGGMAPGVAGLLMSEKLSLGSMTSRDNTQNFTVFPQANPFAGKVVILTDHGSASTSEVFAAGLQENGRAKIVGETTAGAVLPSYFVQLPTRAIFQYAVSDYKSPKNILIEGRGVIPDIAVKQSRQALLKGTDAQLEAAVKAVLN